jgi:D-amino-acid dehydrogenase
MRAVVIGAGVLGASAAYHLVRAGAHVTVVDACLAGRATAAGAGIVCPWVSGVGDPVFYRLYTEAARYYAELVAALGEVGEHDLGFRRVGGMAVSASAVDLLCLERVVRGRQMAAPEMGAVSRLTPREAQALFPPLHAELGAVHVEGGARVDGRRLAAALLRASRHHGAVVRDGEAALVATGGRVVGVRLGSERLEADQVVVTAGSWAPALLRELGIDLPIRPQRGQIVHLRLVGQATQDWPVVLPLGASHYLLAFDDHRVVAGATRESEAGFGYRVTAAGLAEVLANALAVAPGLADAEVIETRIGFRPMGSEVRPLLGAASAVAGLVIGNGLGAAGLTIGPFAGRLLADVALGRAPALNLAPFDPLRIPTPTPDVPVTLRYRRRPGVAATARSVP